MITKNILASGLLFVASVVAATTPDFASLRGNWYDTAEQGSWVCGIYDSLVIINNNVYKIDRIIPNGETFHLTLSGRFGDTAPLRVSITANGDNLIDIVIGKAKTRTLTAKIPVSRRVEPDNGYDLAAYFRTDTVVVRGVVDHYPLSLSDGSSDISISNYITDETDIIPVNINSDGSFSFRHTVNHPSNLSVCGSHTYNVSIPYYAEPGDTVTIYFDAADISDKSAMVNPKEYAGTHASLCYAMDSISGMFKFSYLTLMSARDCMSAADFKEKYGYQMDKWSIEADSLANGKFSPSRKMASLLRNISKIEKGRWLMDFTFGDIERLNRSVFSNGEYKPDIAGEDYYTFLREMPLNDPSIMTVPIDLFLNRFEYAPYLFLFCFDRNDDGSYTLAPVRDDEVSVYTLITERVTGMRNPFLWQVAQANRLCGEYKNSPMSARDEAIAKKKELQTQIEYPFINQQLDNYFERKFSTNDAETYPLPDGTAGNVLRRIMTEHPGKAVYLDFWGTNCGPCIANIRRTADFRAEHRDNPDFCIVFLTSSIESPRDKYEKFVEKNLKGDHSYWLSAKEWSALQVFFRQNALPAYRLIDADGNIFRFTPSLTDLPDFMQKIKRSTSTEPRGF